MSWTVLEANARQARVRAAFSAVVLDQTLTQPAERAESPDSAAMELTIGRDCALRGVAYPEHWSARTRMLVQTQLDNHAFALPPSPSRQWSTPGSDGLGAHTALYRVATHTPLTITRRKIAHAPRGLKASFGIDFRVTRSDAIATFDADQPLWWRRISGRETVTVAADGSEPVTLDQRFVMERADALFTPIPASDVVRVDRQDPYRMPASPRVAAARFESAEAAWNAFADALAKGQEQEAAHTLATWLRAHPEQVEDIVDRLIAHIDPHQHAAIFLAFELTGTLETRDALMTLTSHAQLTPLNQARAALALANHGTPDAQVMDHLLARAAQDDMAARVSLLGAGTLAGRADDVALREALTDALHTRLDAADASDANLVLDAMGNSKDARFADAIGQALAADSATTRLHAATALSRLPADDAAPRLIARLQVEETPRVAAALVHALDATGSRSDAAVAVMRSRLEIADLKERLAIIDWLGKGGDTTRDILVAQYHRELNGRVKQSIGRFVSAQALR